MFSDIFQVKYITYAAKYFYVFRFLILSITLLSFIFELNFKKDFFIPLIFLYIHLLLSLVAYIFIDNKQKDNIKYNGFKDAILFYLLGYIINIVFEVVASKSSIYNFKF